MTLLGAGGVGKTRLAIELARAKVTTATFPGGIWLVELAPLTSPELIASAIAQAVDDGTRRDGSTAERWQRVSSEDGPDGPGWSAKAESVALREQRCRWCASRIPAFRPDELADIFSRHLQEI